MEMIHTAGGVSAAERDEQANSVPVLEYVLGCGRSADPAARGPAEILEVSWICGESVEEVRYFRPGTPVCIGAATRRRLSVLGVRAAEVPAALGWLGAVPGLAVEEGWRHPFPLPASLLGAEERCLFAPDGRGWALEIQPGWAGFVDRGEERLALAQIGDGRRAPIRVGDQLVVEVGSTIFVARLVAESPRLRLEPAGRDGSMAAMVGFAALLMAAVGGAIAVTPPPVARTVEVDDADPTLALWRQIEAKPVTPEKKPAGGAGKEGAGKPGREEMKRGERPEADPAHAGILGALDEMSGEELGSGGLAGAISGAEGIIGARGTQRGVTGLEARAGLFGGQSTADSGGGFPGGRPGRGVPTGAMDGGDRGPEPKISLQEAVILGGLPKQAIDEVVKRNMAAIRYCYQRELSRDPSLGGKVTVKFVIAADGSVGSATTRTTTLNNAAVESCINGRFMRMSFPKPSGGGVVIVSYPFIFSSQ